MQRYGAFRAPTIPRSRHSHTALVVFFGKCQKDLLPLRPELDDEEMANRSKEDYKKEIAELKKRNRDLEKALEFSRLETLARDLMIDKAEECFDIAI